jgi:SAM-dependent methyltransferase
MGFYERRVLPWLIDRGMRNRVMAQYRSRVPALAAGRVLELGTGAGLNFLLYGPGVTHLFALEPADPLRRRAAGPAARARFPVSFLGSGAERIPLDRASVDTVVSTWTLCSIPDVEVALQEVRRVLRPAGRFLFLEHGLAPDADVARSQDRMAPLLRGLAGCNPNRPIDKLIAHAGFAFGDIERAYLEGPRFLAYHFTGTARPL